MEAVTDFIMVVPFCSEQLNEFAVFRVFNMANLSSHYVDMHYGGHY